MRAGTVEPRELVGICQFADDADCRRCPSPLRPRGRGLLEVSCASILPAGTCVDLRIVVEDEELATASDVSDDALAQDGIEESAAVPPWTDSPARTGSQRQRTRPRSTPSSLDEVLPFVLGRARRHRLDEMASVHEGRIPQPGCSSTPSSRTSLHVDPRLLERLSHRRCPRSSRPARCRRRDDAGVVRLVDGVEDEQLVCPGDRMLPGDVDDDSRPDDQCASPRIFALWARFAAW